MPPLRKTPKPRERNALAEKADVELPDIRDDDSFRQVVMKLSVYFKESIEMPSTLEQLRTTSAGSCLRVLVNHLTKTCTNHAIVNALLALKWHYACDYEQQGLGQARSNACEIVAWRFLGRLPERDALDFCLYEIPEVPDPDAGSDATLGGHHTSDPEGGRELTPLLPRFAHRGEASAGTIRPAASAAKRHQLLSSVGRLAKGIEESAGFEEEDPSTAFEGLNALEIAAVADAKNFLSQRVVQKIITGIWNGTIVFWDHISLDATRKPRFYRRHETDGFSRLRVPKYMKIWEIFFFAIFLGLYYTTLLKANKYALDGVEVALWFWFAAFFFDEVIEWADAGSIIYTSDVWNVCDMIVVLISTVFVILRVIGLTTNNDNLNSLAFDILSLEALFLVPRICSIMSLSPYWGRIIPCLKEMGKDFVKFMILVIIIYVGFLTTISLIGRDLYNPGEMTIILTRIFFGSSFIAFDIMNEIDPVFGPPLMIIFVILTNFLILGSLTGILSNTFSRVISHAQEEYLYVYSVYVLGASTSNRLVRFYPPFNFISFIVFRPWSVVFPTSPALQKARILALKATHLPIVAIIKLYELSKRHMFEDEFAGLKGPDEAGSHNDRLNKPQIYSSGSQEPSKAQLGRTGSQKDRQEMIDDRIEEDIHEEATLEAQITELNRKMDVLTNALLAMQEKQSGTTKEKAAAEA